MSENNQSVIFRSKGDAKALFLRHEGFLGALGAFMNYEKNACSDDNQHFIEEQSGIAKGSFCKDHDFESSAHADVKDNGCIECRVQVRIWYLMIKSRKNKNGNDMLPIIS